MSHLINLAIMKKLDMILHNSSIMTFYSNDELKVISKGQLLNSVNS